MMRSVPDYYGQISTRSLGEFGIDNQLYIFGCICNRLQDEYAALQKELKSTVEDSRLIQEKYTKLVDDARSQLAAKIAENEQLMTQVFI